MINNNLGNENMNQALIVSIVDENTRGINCILVISLEDNSRLTAKYISINFQSTLKSKNERLD